MYKHIPLYIIILSLLKIFSQVRHSLMADCMGQNTSTARAFQTSGCRPLIGHINKWKKSESASCSVTVSDPLGVSFFFQH